MHIFSAYSSDPRKRYELFLKATQMDVIIEKLNLCSDQIVKARAQLDLQVKLTEMLKNKRDDAQKKLEQFQSVASLKVISQVKQNCFDLKKGFNFI